MKLFDLHCDTLLEAYRREQTLYDKGLQNDLTAAKAFSAYGQVYAVYSENRLSDDEAYNQFFKVKSVFDSITPPIQNFTPILSVEGGKLLSDDPNRISVLYQNGVRILTLVWAGECRIGGAHNTNIGLHPFGRQTVEQCFDLGILPDLSHASRKMTGEVIEIARKKHMPIIASHSCFEGLYSHSRNIEDSHAKEIAMLGGIIGVNLVPEHLKGNRCTVDDVIDHILYGINLCGEDGIALGGDLDGTDTLPAEINGLRDIPILLDRLSKRAGSERITDKISYDNAEAFFKRTVLEK